MSNVLIVEDDPMVAFINQKFLERIENVCSFGPVSELEEVIDTIQKENIDLILLDAYLPKESGFEMLRTLREKGFFLDVIMITAANTTKEVQQAYAYGVIDYLVKPFEFSRFEKAVQKHFMNQKKIIGKEYVKQQDLDCARDESVNLELPKGLNPNTLDRVIEKLRENSQAGWSLRELAKQLDISNVTVKKYMDYLEQEEQVSVDLNYGQVGRPEYRYYLKP